MGVSLAHRSINRISMCRTLNEIFPNDCTHRIGGTIPQASTCKTTCKCVCVCVCFEWAKPFNKLCMYELSSTMTPSARNWPSCHPRCPSILQRNQTHSPVTSLTVAEMHANCQHFRSWCRICLLLWCKSCTSHRSMAVPSTRRQVMQGSCTEESGLWLDKARNLPTSPPNNPRRL